MFGDHCLGHWTRSSLLGQEVESILWHAFLAGHHPHPFLAAHGKHALALEQNASKNDKAITKQGEKVKFVE